MAIKKVKYIEPEGYIPKHLRKEFGLGEYAEQPPTKDDKKTPTKKTTVKKSDTKKK
jgi:hypothetical protein